jgi:hypothetical protein
MSDSGLARYAPLAGLAFVVLTVAAFVIVGDTPDNDSTTLKVLTFWNDHKDEGFISSILGALAGLSLAWFAGSLRSHLARFEPASNRLANVSFGGGLIAASGILIALNLQFAIVDTVGDVPPVVTQTLFVLSDDFFMPIVGGLALMLIAAGIVGVRHGAFPGWLAWSGIIVAIAGLVLPFPVVLVILLWEAVVSVWLFIRSDDAAPVTPAPAT